MASGHGNGDRWGMDSTHTGEKRVHSHPFFTRAYRRVAANAAGLPFRCRQRRAYRRVAVNAAGLPFRCRQGCAYPSVAAYM